MGHIKDYILGCLLLMAGLWILSGGLAEKGEQHASSVDPAAVKPDRQALLRKVTDNLKDADSLTTIRKGFTQRINDQTAPGIKPHVPSEADLVEESGNYQGIQLDQESKGESIISDLEGESGERLTPFVPQKTFLKLITLGGQQAMASRGWFYCRGAWVWRWKNQIDTGFIS